MIKNVLIALAVAFVAGVGLGFMDRVSGSSSETSFIMPVVLGVFVFFFLQMRSGNRKEVRVDAASRQSSLSAAAPAGQALLYVYREGFMGKMVGWNVTLDGAALAQLRSPRFTQTTVSPGSHSLTVSLGGLAGSQNKPAEATFEANAGEVIVMAMKSKMGALSNTLFFVREANVSAALQKTLQDPNGGGRTVRCDHGGLIFICKTATKKTNGPQAKPASRPVDCCGLTKRWSLYVASRATPGS